MDQKEKERKEKEDFTDPGKERPDMMGKVKKKEKGLVREFGKRKRNQWLSELGGHPCNADFLVWRLPGRA